MASAALSTASDVTTGKERWKFYTVAGPGPARRSDVAERIDAYLRGGGSIWVTGTYDPDQNLVFFGTGNPGPDYFSPAREGDNLYTCSAVALDADTGQMKWHFQFTPHDLHDWDSTQVPVLADLTINGQPRKTMMFANRNGFFYVLDRTNGKMILAKPFVYADLGKGDQPRRAADSLPASFRPRKAARRCPDLGGGTNFFSPSYRPEPAVVLRQRAGDVRDLLTRGTSRLVKASSTNRAARRVRGTRRISARSGPSIR